MVHYHSGYSNIRRKKKSRFSRVLYIILFILFLGVLGVGYQLWVVIMRPNTWVSEEGQTSIYIPSGTDYEGFKSLLYGHGVVVNRTTFEWLAIKKNLPSHIYPGRYIVTEGLNNNELINLFRSGEQAPVKLTFNNIRTTDELSQTIATQLEVDSIEISGLLKDSIFTKKFGFKTSTIISMFIPNTYEVYWNITANDLMARMYTEYNNFWNTDRLQKAENIGFTPAGIVTLASIVDKETTKNDEKPAIAGVYLNRLKYGWRLQADPTIVFAWGDFNIRRVLNIHKQIDSPYNTYKYYGMPPGPICMPSIASIDAVLNREDHSYMYFCAKDDFSGYHVFASTNAQHNINAERYRNALDKLNIRK